MSSSNRRRARSLSPRRLDTPRPSRRRHRSESPPRKQWQAPDRNGKRTFDEAFDDDDDNEWIFHPDLTTFLWSLQSPSIGLSSDRPSSSQEGIMFGGGGTPLLDFQLRPIGARRNWRKVLNKQRFQGRIQQHRDATPSDDLGRELTEALRRTIRRQIEADNTLTPHSTLHFVMQSDAFTHAFQSTTFTVGEFEDGSERLDTYLQSLAAKLNSNQDFSPDDTFTLETTFIHTPGPGRGNGKKYRPGREAVEKLLARKRSVIQIKNKDELCCARAIVTMRAWIDEGNRGLNYQNISKGYPIQTRLAKELHQKAGVPEGPCGLRELQKFQDVLPGYQIKVLSVDKPHSIIFHGPDSHKRILLIKVDDHYHGCNSFKGFLGKSYFCHDCNRGYNQEDIKHHWCKGKWCRSCERADCPDFTEVKRLCEPGQFPSPTVSCGHCHRYFFGEACYASHKIGTAKRKPLCDVKKKCLACHKVYDAAPVEKKRGGDRKSTKYRHRCGWSECPFCQQQVDQTKHQCFIQPVDPGDDKPKLKKVNANEVGSRHTVRTDEDGSCWVEELPPLFVYADYEAVTDDDGVQTPILVCCEDEEEDETHSFYGPTCTDDLFDHLDALSVDEYGDERRVIVIFHNFKGYDGMFVLQHLYATHREVEDQICVGTKVLSLRSGNLTFKDSLCFLPFSLASFPATFGLAELRKGFFPHLFNTLEHQEYVGPMPEESFYDPDGMTAKKKGEFQRWHAQKVAEEYVFNLRHEMKEYCISDVKLLKAGCMKFQSEFESHADFRPMEKCVTIASACNRFWRKKLLPKNTIAVEPPPGWHGARTTTSLKARQWLAWQEHLLRMSTSTTSRADELQADRIRHSCNGGEVRVLTPVQSYFVDGYDDSTQTVYEFHGCLWHGCPNCFPDRTKYSKLNRDRTFQEMYEATRAKENIIRTSGYTLKVLWECQWDWLVKEDVDLQAFLSNLELVKPLEPRDAFFGGRTNAASLYHKTDTEVGEEIKYVDVTSLYPWVNANGEYPVGHPDIITNPVDQDIHSYFGVALVDVLPPYFLYHPVLPHRQGSKLTFPLCRTCVQEEMPKPLLEKSSACTHSDEERILRGTWCTPELVKAVELGYNICKIHEVWHFPNRQRGLFADYVKKWLKIKQESAGYPSWAQTEEQKQTYRSNYTAHEGINLDPTLIRKNPGRKATAKLMLNSFWGKFGENLNKPCVAAVDSPATLFHWVSNPLLTINAIRICTDDQLEIVFTNIKDNQLDNGKRNIFVAAFTTCLARLKLYESLEKLGDQALYFDTDSVIYRWKPGQTDIPLGDYLGDMTNELEDGGHITEFVSGGPKNYGYTTSTGKVCCKVRGFTLNVRGSQQLNYEVMRQNVLDELHHPLEERRITNVENPYFFTRHPATKCLRIIPRIKQYGLVFDKRVVDSETYKSYPYGYTSTLDDVDMANVDVLMDL